MDEPSALTKLSQILSLAEIEQAIASYLVSAKRISPESVLLIQLCVEVNDREERVLVARYEAIPQASA